MYESCGCKLNSDGFKYCPIASFYKHFIKTSSLIKLLSKLQTTEQISTLGRSFDKQSVFWFSIAVREVLLCCIHYADSALMWRAMTPHQADLHCSNF